MLELRTRESLVFPGTLSDLINRFMSSRRNVSPHTIEFYRRLLKNFRWYAKTHDWPEDPAQITKEDVNQFLDYVSSETYRWPGDSMRLSTKRAAPSTVHHYGRVVKTLFNWAEEEEYLKENPIRRLKLGPPKYREVAPYSDEEVRAMLEVCEDDALRYRYSGVRNRAMISLFVATGLRVEEMASIRISEIDSRLGQVRVMGKGAKSRVVPISRKAAKALRQYLELRPPGGDELWKSDDGQPMTVRGVKTMIQRVKVRAGVDSGGGAHRFRHYFATRYLEAGGDLNSLRLLLGHSTLEMVLRYSRYVDISRALARHEQFDPLEHLYRG